MSAALFACAGMERQRGHAEVAKNIKEHLGANTHWEDGPPQEPDIAKWVGSLLEGGLTKDRAIEIALMNNRSLQATYEELGISQADLVQAGLLKNPSLSLHIGFPLSSGQNELTGSLVQDFLDLFMLPLRKRIAQEQFATDVLRVSNEAIQVASRASQEYLALQAAEQLVEMQQTIVETTDSASELAQRQFEAGNINALALTEQTAFHEQALIDFWREQTELLSHRERLNVLLGLWGPQTDWKLQDRLPTLPKSDPGLEHVEALAIELRFDIAAARNAVTMLGRAVTMARDFRLFGTIEIGVDGHQDPDGPRVMGPSLRLELPIFDQRQAMIGRLEAQERQAERRLAALSIQARSDVRLARAKLQAARATAGRYDRVLQPLRGKIVDLSQLYYNGMFVSPYQLLMAKQAQTESSRAAVMALRDYWTARAELELAIGRRLDAMQ